MMSPVRRQGLTRDWEKAGKGFRVAFPGFVFGVSWRRFGPNKAMEPTANSVRSYLTPAAGGGSSLALGLGST